MAETTVEFNSDELNRLEKKYLQKITMDLEIEEQKKEATLQADKNWLA